MEPLLKEIVLEGFKSFRDRTGLKFDGPFTAIVGPNGSGKSNVVDAVKWVLGDQSPRSIRASSGQEAVWRPADGNGGAESGFASVMLKVNNIKPETDDEPSEWEIERRYYRSGESVYSINGKTTRLKDVRALMSRMGFGLGSLSVVGQGEIDGFLSLVPADRRLVFEDLARISDFKANKRKILSQLDECARNHQRMEDLTGEITVRVETLSVQADAARRHAELTSEKEEVEAQLAAQEYLLARRNLERHEQRLEDLREELETSRKNRDGLVDALKNAKEELEKARKENAATLSECEEGRRELDRATAEERRLTDADRHFGTLISTLAGELEEREIRIERIRKRQEELKEIAETAEIESVRAKLRRLDYELFQSRRWGYMRSCERERERLAAKVERLQGEGSFFARDAEFHSRRADALQSELEKLTNSKRELSAEIIEIEKDTARLSSEYDILSMSNDEIVAALDSLETERDCVILELESLRDKHRVVSSDVATLEKERKILGELEAGNESYGEGVRSILERRDEFSGLVGTLGELIAVETGYEKPVERALGESIGFLVCETLDEALRIINFAKDNKLGSVTCIVTELVPDTVAEPAELLTACSTECGIEKIINLLLGGATVAENIAGIDVAGITRALVTSDGIVFRPPAFVSGGSDVASASGVLTRRARLDELEGLITANRWNAAALAARISQLESSLGCQNEMLSELRIESERLRTSLQQNIIFRQKHSERLDRISREATGIEKKISELQVECDGCRENAHLASMGTEAVKRARVDSEDGLSRIENEIPRIGSDVEDLRARVQRSIVEEASYTEESQRSHAEIKRLETDIESEQEENDSKRKGLEEIKQEAADTSEELNRAIELRKSLEEKLPELEKRESEADERIEAFEKALTDAEESLEDARGRVTSIENSVHTQEIRLAEMKGGLVSLEKELDEYPEFAERIRSGELAGRDIPSKKELSEKLEIINTDLEEVGDVNPLAIEEERLARQRLDEIKRERQDLLSAEDDLREALEEIESQSEKAFVITFNEAKERFAEVFSALFPGGTGELSLTDPSDPLESGIDVKVRFPGKGELDLLQFSGGERSLIALALLFAILKVKPSSFTILDEVEAALDDVNTQKFLDYLGQEFLDRQFILITHNKISMERANRLYGVTMRGGGVSQIVSVDLKKLKEQGIEQVLGKAN